MKMWQKICISTLMAAMMMTTPAMAEWTDMEKGPGVAQWIDENGNVTEPVQAEKTEEQAASGQGTADPAAGLAAAQQSAAGRVAAEQAAAQPAAAEPETAGQAASGTRTIDPSRPMVALTFDDGPQTDVDNRILDCLAKYGGKATFFMVGDRVASRAGVVQRMAAEGHELANHTLNHKYLNKVSAAEVRAQVQQCNDVIESVSGVRPTLMRLPGGIHNESIRANVQMPMIQWSIDTLDWKTRNADKTVAAVVGKVKDGDIVLMHDLYSPTGDAAERIIAELTNQGYQLVTVSELAAAKGKTLEAGQVYSAIR